MKFGPHSFRPSLVTSLALMANAFPAPARGQSAPLGADAIGPVLAALDAAFARGDLAGHGDAFVPDHPGAHAMLQLGLQRRIQGTTQRERTSKLTTEPRQIGDRTVVRVRQDYRLQGGSGASATVFSEDVMFALRTRASGEVVPTFAIAIAAGNGWVRNDLFRCPACNYQIGGVPGWLCLQMRSDVASSLEAASFYLIGSDIACDVSVQVETPPRLAATVAAELATAMQRLEPSAEVGTVVPWTPPAHVGDAIANLDGARVELQLANSERMRCHVVTFGGLQHLLLVRGSASSLQTHDATIAALLASYCLLEQDCDLSLAAARPLQHHGGGEVAGTTYRNPHFGIELVGAEGWQPVLRTGGAAFRVTWTSRDGSRLWLTGHQVPPGMSAWTAATADRWLAHLCEQQQLAITSASSAWCDGNDPGPLRGGKERTLVCSPRQPSDPMGPTVRTLRVLLHDDLLVIADGFAKTAADATALRTMLAAVQRR